MGQGVSQPSESRADRVPPALEGRRLAWAVVELDAISHNLRAIRHRVGGSRRVLAVVKANAYGHGAVQVARRLESEGADLLGVAFPEEGVELRQAGIRAPILVLGASSAGQIALMVGASLTPTAYSIPFLDALLAAAPVGSPPLSFHLKVDTGMGRLGLMPSQLPHALASIAACGGRAVLEGVFTTLSCSDDPTDRRTADQVESFGSVIRAVRAAGHSPTWIHAANSGGVIDHPPAWLDTVRPGIMLYGIHPSAQSSRMDLRPALSWKTSIVLRKAVPAGTALGYSGAFVTSRPSIIGTSPVGYADGLSRRIAAQGHALVRGRPAPYAGRISMDHFMIDMTDILEASEGDEVVLLGSQCQASIKAEQLADWAGTIPYEILSRIGPRVPRLYAEKSV